MRQYWRMQQSQAVVGLLLWGTTITLLVWPYVRWRFESSCADALCFNDTIAGIPATYFGLLSIFMTVMLGVLTIGYLYDQVFSLWTEWRSVDMERNPYVTYALTPNWMMNASTPIRGRRGHAISSGMVPQVVQALRRGGNVCSGRSTMGH
jgi:hypothetical protein